MKIMGMDIGGANTKVASSDGGICELHYVPLWKDTRLPEVLRRIAEKHKPDTLAVVITGELADCFEDKAEGIKSIVSVIKASFDTEIRYMDTAGNLVSAIHDPRELAAANWVASARLLGRETGDVIFVDMGSTTCDIIPVKDGKPVSHTTDTERLAYGELLYQGVLRTNAAAILDRVGISVGNCRVASELFATSGDAYLLLGDLDRTAYTCETADGAGIEKRDAARRLARVVCADVHEVSDEDINRISRSIKEKQIGDLQEGIREVARRHHLDTVICAGLGEFLIAEACERLEMECFSVAQKWGAGISTVFPAYAAARLLEMESGE
jgi:hypothetical protein